MERWRGRVALVTGASKGIGSQITRVLASHGLKVVACARSEDKLQELAEELQSSMGDVFPIRCDLRSEVDILKMFAAIEERWGGVDVCVNNAGLALNASIIDGDSEDWRTMIDVNVMAVCYCTRESVRSMRRRQVDDGQVININSLSGHRVGKAHFYSATKFALTSLTEGTRWELRGIDSHIRVTSISPGLVKTNFASVLMGEAGAAETYNTRQYLEAKDIADMVVTVLSTPKHVQIHDILVRPTEQLP
ncbi:dehydrogenase/reductase SDR family member 11-like [Liolophura sinensis]|uniref:dehydrogenase/reductase SDR family member 11-like n=1 Tax=Liolophura sinensis TaxID=3198878 RepID=UPI0031595095